jgi:hypothetical protein
MYRINSILFLRKKNFYELCYVKQIDCIKFDRSSAKITTTASTTITEIITIINKK